MDTRNILGARLRARGAVQPMAIAIIAVVALLLVGAWFLIVKPHRELLAEEAGGPSTAAPVSAQRAGVPPPANVASMDIDQLLGEARRAINDQRYLSPAGNNAYEYYLRVLERQPGNKVASDAMRETFPFAAASAEQSVNSRDFGEAQRQIDLLAKADPANFTLTILRSKLDAQRKVIDKQQQQELDDQKAQLAAAAQKEAAEKAAAEQVEQLRLAAQAEQQRAQEARAAQLAAQQAAAQQSQVAQTANESTGAGETSDAVLLKGFPARFPTAAMRARQDGWVLVSFTIGADGRTTDVKVLDSSPRRVFDRAAMDAVERYRFTPAMRNGVAVPSVKQQRIEFKL